MSLHEYLDSVNARFRSGISREHSYRADLENLIKSIVPHIHVTNEPADVTDCGNPDYVLTKGKIPVGYIEAKDIGKDLASKVYDEQFTRYREALDNLIITDYLWFRFYDHGELVHEIRIGEIVDGKLQPLPENFQQFENLIINFSSFVGQTIKSSKKLAVMMANKARLLQNILENAITSDERTQENTSLKGQFETFKEILIHDLTPKGFADIYAQTLAYGMFAARLHDPTLADFSRQEAAELIPKSNPFLRKLFGYVAGPDIDERIKTVVDNLAEVFRATNVEQLLKNFGKNTQTQDAIIHFYETFLAEYDPKLRKSRGVWYTPEPVVKFIVRAVDDILKTEFNLPQGLADTSKTTIKVNTDIADKRSATGYKQVEKEVHKVQILDPATGTGTFLAEVISYIYSRKFEKMQGVWSSYVEEHLIPRLNGFELLMASYAMAHLKLDMLLKETGYQANGSSQRLNVYLTNSLEEHHKDTGTLFSNWLSTEANEANHIKRDTPLMCVIGNPPYSGESSNKGRWILDLMEDYKKEPGGKVKLKEKNSKWINDDYVKFMRYGQHFIEKNGEGILAFINPHGFLDNPTFRGMRWNLLKTYDKIYTIDLHGNTKKKESAPDGSKDENIFDITQGVAINILIKTRDKPKKELAKVFHKDLYGKREFKYHFLSHTDFYSIAFKTVKNNGPEYLFKELDYELHGSYKSGFNLTELFLKNGNGIVSKRDKIAYQENRDSIREIVQEIQELEETEIVKKYDNVSWTSRDGKVEFVKEDVVLNGTEIDLFTKCLYRPFDLKWTYYTGKSKGFIGWPVKQIMEHFIAKRNLGLVVGRQGQVVGSMPWNLIFISKEITDFNLFYRGGGMLFPLYLYPEKTDQAELESSPRREPNLNKKIVDQISHKLGLEFLAEEPEEGEVCFAESRELRDDYKTYFTPLDLLDYIYAVLHSPTYRETYKEFLKIDFPRVPYPDDQEKFWQLVKLGGELRSIHLLESKKVEDFITSYPAAGDNLVSRKMTKNSPGFIPNKEMLKQDQHDEKENSGGVENNVSSSKDDNARHPELDSGSKEMLKQVQHDERDSSGVSSSEVENAHHPESGSESQNKEMLKQVQHDEKDSSDVTSSGVENSEKNVTARRETTKQSSVGKVWINDEQYFDNVPEVAWEFYIGGYQPAQKWLKDRKGRKLSFEDILHYQKIIVALTETDRLMKEIDKIEIIKNED